MPHISYTKKDGTKLQEDDDLKTGDDAFVEYLIKSESGFEIVSYENWQVSSDGYYYFRGTEALQNYMKADLAQGVVLVNIQASPIKYGINYVSGAGRHAGWRADLAEPHRYRGYAGLSEWRGKRIQL